MGVSGRDLLMPKPGAPLDTDTWAAMEGTVLDTVSGRDLLMPGMDADMEVMGDTAVDMEVMVDTDMVDTVERDLPMPGTDADMVDTEDTGTLDLHTESKFCISMPMLPFLLLYLLNNNVIPFLQEKQPKLSFNMFHQKLRKSFEIDIKVTPKNKMFHKECA